MQPAVLYPTINMAALEYTIRSAHVQIRSLLTPWTPTTTALRWRTRKPNIQRPIPDHYLKARFKAALEPIYPNPLANKPWFEVCGNVIKKTEEEEEYKYERLLANELHRKLSSSSLIAILQENSTKAQEKNRIRGMLHGKGMQFAFASTKIARMGLVGTDLEPLLRLHVGRTCYLCCEQAEVAKLLKLLKKMPTYVLLGGYMDGRLLTKNQLLWCSTLPSLDILRAELCSILSSSMQRLSQNLIHHQQNLSWSLEEHIKLSGEVKKET